MWARARQTAGINFIRCHLRMPCLTQHMLARGTKAGRGQGRLLFGLWEAL